MEIMNLWLVVATAIAIVFLGYYFLYLKGISKLRKALQFLATYGRLNAWICFRNKRTGKFIQYRLYRVNRVEQICACIPTTEDNMAVRSDIEEISRRFRGTMELVKDNRLNFMVVGFSTNVSDAFGFGSAILFDVYGISRFARFEYTLSDPSSFDLNRGETQH
jgi:hypothetical protein